MKEKQNQPLEIKESDEVEEKKDREERRKRKTQQNFSRFPPRLSPISVTHKLPYKWTLWYHDGKSDWVLDSYQKIYEFDTVEDFWRLMNNLPSIVNSMFFLMRDGHPPIWEVPQNINGGSWLFKFPKKMADCFWLKLACYLVGGTMMIAKQPTPPPTDDENSELQSNIDDDDDEAQEIEETQETEETQEPTKDEEKEETEHDGEPTEELPKPSPEYMKNIIGLSISPKIHNVTIRVWNSDSQHSTEEVEFNPKYAELIRGQPLYKEFSPRTTEAVESK